MSCLSWRTSAACLPALCRWGLRNINQAYLRIYKRGRSRQCEGRKSQGARKASLHNAFLRDPRLKKKEWVYTPSGHAAGLSIYPWNTGRGRAYVDLSSPGWIGWVLGKGWRCGTKLKRNRIEVRWWWDWQGDGGQWLVERNIETVHFFRQLDYRTLCCCPLHSNKVAGLKKTQELLLLLRWKVTCSDKKDPLQIQQLNSQIFIKCSCWWWWGGVYGSIGLLEVQAESEVAHPDWPVLKVNALLFLELDVFLNIT